jgi:hypothetical protein
VKCKVERHALKSTTLSHLQRSSRPLGLGRPYVPVRSRPNGLRSKTRRGSASEARSTQHSRQEPQKKNARGRRRAHRWFANGASVSA